MKRMRLIMCMVACCTGLGLGQPTLSGVKFIDASTAVAVRTSGTVLRSNDGGLTWFSQPSGTSNHLFSVSFTSSSTGTAVGGDPISRLQTILHTANSGSNWSPQVGAFIETLLGVSFADQN